MPLTLKLVDSGWFYRRKGIENSKMGQGLCLPLSRALPALCLGVALTLENVVQNRTPRVVKPDSYTVKNILISLIIRQVIRWHFLGAGSGVVSDHLKKAHACSNIILKTLSGISAVT